LPTEKQTGLGLHIPQEQAQVNKIESEWNVYRTRFLIKAKKLTKPLKFVDALGREHQGKKGDYLMEWCDGLRRIAPKEFFEDVYVQVDSTSPQDAGTLFPLRKIPVMAAMEKSARPMRRHQTA